MLRVLAPSAGISGTVDTAGARVVADGQLEFTILGATAELVGMDGLLDHRANYDQATGVANPMNFIEFDVRFLGQTVVSEPPREDLKIEYEMDILKLDKDWKKTKVYSLGMGFLFLNLEGREPKGIVKPEEADALMAEVREKLQAAA